MKRGNLYKKIKKALLEEAYRASFKNFSGDDFIPGRFSFRMVALDYSEMIDRSYPTTNRGIPFYFGEAYGSFELIDYVNPINNLIIIINAWGDNSTKKTEEDEEYNINKVNTRIGTSVEGNWSFASWVQQSETGRALNSPSGLDQFDFPERPTRRSYTQKEIKEYATLFSSYIKDLNTTIYDDTQLMEEEKYFPKMASLITFKKKYIMLDNSDNILYGVLADRRYSKTNPYFIIFKDPKIKDDIESVAPSHITYRTLPYFNLRAIMFDSKDNFIDFINLLDDDIRDEFKLLNDSFNLSNDEFKYFLTNSVKSAFIDSKHKDLLLKVLNQKFVEINI